MLTLFLHGFPFNKSCWDDQISRLSSSYTSQAIDLRGHGKALSPPGPWMIEDFVEDVKTHLDQNKIGKVVLCGLSMGGYVALHFALTYPERLAGLILCNTRADADSNEVKDKRYETLKVLRKNDLDKFAEEFSKSVLGETTLRENPELQQKVKSIIVQNKAENMAMTIGAMASRRDSFPYLNRIACPTLVLTGIEDRVVPPEVTEAMSQKISQAQFYRIPGAGHLSNMENPAAFEQHLMHFLLGLKNVS